MHVVQWSKLKERVRGRICPELRSRVDFHVTSYRGSHDDAEKVWITIDGVRLATYSWYQKQWKPFHRDEKGRLTDKSLPKGDPVYSEWQKMHLPQDFGVAMRLYLDLSVQQALASTNPLIRAFALIDRRCGKRSFDAATVTDDDDPLIRAFWQARRNLCD